MYRALEGGVFNCSLTYRASSHTERSLPYACCLLLRAAYKPRGLAASFEYQWIADVSIFRLNVCKADVMGYDVEISTQIKVPSLKNSPAAIPAGQGDLWVSWLPLRSRQSPNAHTTLLPLVTATVFM